MRAAEIAQRIGEWQAGAPRDLIICHALEPRLANLPHPSRLCLGTKEASPSEEQLDHQPTVSDLDSHTAKGSHRTTNPYFIAKP